MGITPKDPADFDPTMGNYKDLQPFRFWCQKVLPLVYDDSLSYYEVLCKLVDYLNKTMEDVGVLHDDVDALHTAYQLLQSYVNDYFSTLDVQQEINNKLNVMASDGTLDALLLPYFNAYKTEINQIVSEQNNNIDTLINRMDSFSHLAEGSTTGDAELADIRVGDDGVIYNTAGDAVRGQVNKLELDFAPLYNSGNEYKLDDLCTYKLKLYKCISPTTGTWDSSKWSETSLKNEFLTRLILKRNFVYDSYSSTTGGLSDLNDAEINSIYTYLPASNSGKFVQNMPPDMPNNGRDWFIITFETYYNTQRRIIQYVVMNDLSTIYERAMQDTTWYDWHTLKTPDDRTCVEAYDYLINDNGTSVLTHGLSNLNDCIANTFYVYVQSNSGEPYVQNLPPNKPNDGGDWIIFTLESYNNTQRRLIQYCASNDLSLVYRRFMQGTTWYDWHTIKEHDRTLVTDFQYFINDNGTSSLTHGLSDLDDCVPNIIYTYCQTNSGEPYVQNLPPNKPNDGNDWFIFTFESYNNTQRRLIQYCVSADLSIVYRRLMQGTTWYNWRTIRQPTTSQRSTIVVDISGGGDYTKFTDGLAAAYTLGNVDLYVKNGVYDITQEIDLSASGSGPLIGNNTNVFFDSDAIIQCYYNGDSSAVQTAFSPINAGVGDFEIHNMKIKCKNTRYCVHDERGSNAVPYNHRYINCEMYLDNSESNWDSPQCIGGGLGKFGVIEIDGGYYEGSPHVGDNSYGEISYHNSAAADAISQIFIKNIYCKNNTVRFGYYGDSTKVTNCYVNGCSFNAQPRVRAETSSSIIENIKMTEWNNTVRD